MCGNMTGEKTGATETKTEICMQERRDNRRGDIGRYYIQGNIQGEVTQATPGGGTNEGQRRISLWHPNTHICTSL